MLLDYDPLRPLYIFGTGNPAHELRHWLISDEAVSQEPELIDQDQFQALPYGAQCIIGFANPQYRKRLVQSPLFAARSWVGFVHARSCVENIKGLGRGVIVQPMACVGFGVTVGNLGWITTMSHVGHGTIVGSNVVISPGTMIMGQCQIGSSVWFGASSVVADKITICDDCHFLMTSVVTKNISAAGQYYGNRKING